MLCLRYLFTFGDFSYVTLLYAFSFFPWLLLSHRFLGFVVGLHPRVLERCGQVLFPLNFCLNAAFR